MKSRWRSVAMVAMAFVCVIVAAAGWAVGDRTLVSPVLPVAIALCAGAVTLPLGVRMWRWLTGSDNRLYNGIVHMVIAGVVVYTATLSCNRYLADPESVYTETVTVEHKYRKSHDTHRRIRRHSYVKTGVRHTYYISVCYPSGVHKDIEVPLSYYNRFRAGGTYDF